MISQPLTLYDILLRVGAALFVGFVVGLEREERGRAAGLRTYILVSCASAIAMIVAHLFYTDSANDIGNLAWRPDPNRMAQGILAGMGFLGAGTIIRQGNIIHGLTTAAGLWFVTIVGLALGSGYFLLGLIGLIVALLTLFLLPRLEHRMNTERYATLALTLAMDGDTPAELRTALTALGAVISRVEMAYNLPDQQRTLQFDIHFKGAQHGRVIDFPQQCVDHLLSRPGVLQVKWTQQN